MTLRRAAFLLAAPVLVLLGAACGDGSGPASQAASPAGRTFLSGSVSDGGAPRSLVEGTPRLGANDAARPEEKRHSAGNIPLGPGAAVLRDYTKSMKHHWHEAAYIPDLSDASAAWQVAQRFLELRDTDFTGGFVLRRFEVAAPGPLVIEARTADGARCGAGWA